MTQMMRRGSRLFTTAMIFCIAAAAAAQQRYGDRPASHIPGYGLNKIISESGSLGPLSRDRTIAAAYQPVIFWSEPASKTDSGRYDAYHFRILSYIQGNGNVTPDQRLFEDGSLTGDTVIDASTGAEHPAIAGNKRSIILAGDMNGDGFDELAAVWETYDISGGSSARVFAAVVPVNKSDLSFQGGAITGEPIGFVTPTASNYDGEVRARFADLMGDGREELVVAWHDPTDNMIHISVFGYSSAAPSHLMLIDSLSDRDVPAGNPSYSMFALAAGDFTHDSTDQVVLAGFASDSLLYIKLYELNAGDKLVPGGMTEFAPISSGSITNLAMATGDFTGDDFKDDIALAVTCSGVSFLFGSGSILYVAQPSTDLQSVRLSTDSSGTYYGLSEIVFANQPGTDIACGDLNGDGTDEIAFGTYGGGFGGDEIAVFEAKQNGSYFQPVFESNTYVPGSSQGPEFSGGFLRVGALDQSADADITVLHTDYNVSGDSAYQALDLEVLGVTDSAFTLAIKAEKTSYMQEYTSAASGFQRHFALALGDFDQGSLILGQPSHFYVSNIEQPLIILNAPPVHFDVFDGKSYDICKVFNGGSNYGNFVTSYDQSTTNMDMMESEVNTSYGLGASLSGNASYAAVKVSASLKTHYGINFDKVQNSSYSNTVSVDVGAQQEDEIYAIVDNYDLWEYPVMDSSQVKGHVLVTVPSLPIGEWFDTESWSAYSFVPDHVVGNVLSYLTYDSLQNNPYLLQLIEGSVSIGYNLGTNSFKWNLTSSNFSQTSASTTQTFKLNVAADIQVGKKFGGFGASVKAGVSGDYSNSNLTSHTSSVTSDLNLAVYLGAIDQSIGEDQYFVSPYAYWGDNGALVVDYAVKPDEAPPAGTETWWQKIYGHEPDPAMALPYLDWPEEGFTVEDPTKIYQTKEIFCDPDNPAPGDTVTTTIRIHNYSLIPTDSSVEVSIYVGEPDSGGTIIRDINGATIFSTPGPIAARGSQILTVKWIAPSTVKTRFAYSGDYVHVWDLVDPQNKINEIHEDNNMGWSILEIPGIITAVAGRKNVPTTFVLNQNYPNPFNPSTVIGYQLTAVSEVTLKVYDVLGREVATLVSGMEQAGTHSVRFDGSKFSSGVYFYSIVARGMDGKVFRSTKKLMLLK